MQAMETTAEVIRHVCKQLTAYNKQWQLASI